MRFPEDVTFWCLHYKEPKLNPKVSSTGTRIGVNVSNKFVSREVNFVEECAVLGYNKLMHSVQY